MPYAKLENGMRMAYEIEGSGEPLLLVPALGRERTSWGAQKPKFIKSFTCISYDPRGCGQSEKTDDPYTMDQMAEDAVQLLDALNIEKAHVLGYSMGSAVVQQMAIRYPDRMKSVVLAATWTDSTPNLTIPFETLLSLAQSCTPLEVEKAVIWWVFSSQFINTQWNIVNKIIEEGARNAIPSEIFISQTKACIAHKTLEELYKINCPCLIVSAEQDRLIPAEESLKVHQGIYGSQYVCIRGAGSSHAFTYERADEFNQIVLEFLQHV
jgi:pimeloyl-ACP methyl ester carboxylesterase